MPQRVLLAVCVFRGDLGSAGVLARDLRDGEDGIPVITEIEAAYYQTYGKWVEARDALMALIKVEPNYLKLKSQLSNVYLRLGDTENAEKIRDDLMPH